MSYEFFSVSTRRAAKPHRCEQCGGAIIVGEEHSYGAGKVDGDFWSYREHSDCRAAWLKHVVEHLEYYDEAPFLRDLATDERDGIVADFPEVAARLGWKADVSTVRKTENQEG